MFLGQVGIIRYTTALNKALDVMGHHFAVFVGPHQKIENLGLRDME